VEFETLQDYRLRGLPVWVADPAAHLGAGLLGGSGADSLVRGIPYPMALPVSLRAGLLVLLAVPVCGAAQQPFFVIPPSEMEPTIRRFASDRSSVNSFYGLPFSENTRQRREAFLEEWQGRLPRAEFAKMSPGAQIEYVLLRNYLESEERGIAFDRKRRAEIEELVPFAPRVASLEEARWGVEPLDPQRAAGELAAMAEEIRGIRRRLQAGLDARGEPPADALKITPVIAQRAAQSVGSIRSALERWFRHYDGFKPIFSWWNRQPYEVVRKELTDYQRFLNERIAGIRGQDEDPLIGDPIGREAILSDLQSEMIAYTPEELIKIAEIEFAWCEQEMLRASREMGFGEDWRAALEKVKSLHVPPGEQDDLVARQSREAIEFVEKRNLVTIEPLAKETWRVDMLDQAGQRTLPFAAYGGQRVLVAYPLDTMDHDTKLMSMRGNNIHFSRIVTPHELIPGHHLQGYMSQRYRDHRRIFGTPFYGEGWCLHWEMLLWDLDYPQTPEDRIGMLFWRMHRAARIIVSLGFHLGQMQPKEMIDFLVDRVGHERFTATSEVRRFIGSAYSPLYQCAYMIGGLQIRALYDTLVGLPDGAQRVHLRPTTKPTMTAREFHDQVLLQNSIPIEMVRVALTGEKIAPDHRPTWDFAGLRR
jgi:hypothetical protein